jgi:hypothetical protein
MLIIKCNNPIVGTVNIMTSQVLPFLVDAHGLKDTAKARARKFLKISLRKAASSLNRESNSRNGFIVKSSYLERSLFHRKDMKQKKLNQRPHERAHLSIGAHGH